MVSSHLAPFVRRLFRGQLSPDRLEAAETIFRQAMARKQASRGPVPGSAAAGPRPRHPEPEPGASWEAAD